jgi:DNA polymerase I-like protein with 3'-5' exonuclease and polymerase domains
MKLITIDFETFYSADIGFAKQTTEEYVRDPQFHVIGVAVKVDNEETAWASGTHEELKTWLDQFDWADSIALAHNAMFDGFILNEHFNIRPKFWADTLCMGRAICGVEVSGSLAALTERYGLGAKGTEVHNFKGYRREDFSEFELSKYGDYCINDVNLTYALFNKMLADGFPKKEMHVINQTVRMFTEPVLELDATLLTEHLSDVQGRKAALLAEVNMDKEDLMSNQKFAMFLEALGVPAPKKISPTTGKETLALAKNDEEFKALAEHPDVRVQALVAARLGTKSTLEETRTQRFIGIASRGKLPVPIKYYAAHTGRFGGDDKINLQNLPSRGENAGKLKKAIIAPEGYEIIDADSAQIEARVLAWLSGQADLVEVFENNNAEIRAGVKKKDMKYDPYKRMASQIYGKPSEEISDPERFVGKTTILGCGYGMGAVKFQGQLKTFGVEVSLDEARRIIDIYRRTNPAVTALWKQAQNMLVGMSRAENSALGKAGVLSVDGWEKAIKLPSGLLMRYNDLKFEQTENGVEFSYKTRYGRTRIYGGKVIENVCQAIARCIIAEQMLKIGKRYKVVLTVHDAIACVVPEAEVAEAQAYVEECMRWTPDWAAGLPVNCESGHGKAYGDC